MSATAACRSFRRAPWNRHRPTFFVDIREVEDWTLNGPILDGMSFVTGLKSGRYLIRQSKRADQQVPKFRDDMTPPEIAAMLETLYRVRGGAVDFQDVVAAAAPIPRREQRLPVRLRASRRRRGVAQGPRGRRGDRRPAVPDPARCRAVALLRRDPARFRGDRRLGPAAAA